MGCKRVPELVRIQVRADAERARVAAHNAPETLTGERPTTRGLEQVLGGFAWFLWANDQVFADMQLSDLAEGHQAALAAFAERHHESALQIHVTQLEVNELTGAKACSVCDA